MFAEHPSCTPSSVVGAGDMWYTDRQGPCRGKRQTIMNKKRSDHEMTQGGGIKTMCGQKRLLLGSNFGTET